MERISAPSALIQDLSLVHMLLSECPQHSGLQKPDCNSCGAQASLACFMQHFWTDQEQICWYSGCQDKT